MAAGLGFKDFVTGEVLTAADVDGYLMQGVWVFASAAARDAAVTSPQEGNFAYLKDTNVTTYYTGSAWANLDTTGMTNPMTTTGDTIYSSSGSTPARLGIGTAGQVLAVNSGATAPEWVTSTSGGMTLLSTTTLSGATTTISSISGSYTNLIIYIYGATNATGDGDFRCAPNGSTTSVQSVVECNTGISQVNGGYLFISGQGTAQMLRTDANNVFCLTINNYTNTNSYKSFFVVGGYETTAAVNNWGMIKTNSAISSLVFSNSGGSHSAGTVLIYGVK